MIRNLKDIDLSDLQVACERLRIQVSKVLLEQGIKEFSSTYEVDLRYRGQATNLPVEFDITEVLEHGFSVLQKRWVFLRVVIGLFT